MFNTICQITRHYLPEPVILNTNTDIVQTSEVLNATGVLMLCEITQFKIQKEIKDRAISPLWGYRPTGYLWFKWKIYNPNVLGFSSSCSEGRE
jgi:hypothetical protein